MWTGVGARTRARTVAGADPKMARSPATVLEAGPGATVTSREYPVRWQLFREVFSDDT